MNESTCDLLSIDLDTATRLRAHRLPVEVAERLAAAARVAADPLRLILLTALADADSLCVCDLAWVTDRADNLVSHHLRLLRAAGMVASRKDGKLALYRITELGRSTLAAVHGVGHEAGVGR